MIVPKKLEIVTGKYKLNVARLAEITLCNVRHRLFYVNWFKTLDLIHNWDKEPILSVCTIRSNSLQGCPLIASVSKKS